MFGLILKFRSSFQLKHSKYVPAYQLTLKEYIHDSKAKLIHLETDDPNQTFATLFRCEPDSDKGTPHILEHMICCGSEKYPVKDPFMQMDKRSLNSYFNAWTGTDFICFPFASLNQKDFNNLLDVTLDMVFKAKLDLADFYQEGIRLDMENGQFQFKGVVYNEMKGAMQNSQSVFEQYIFQHLMHGTIYQYNSGGEPKEIPKLQYQEIKDMYQKVFSPQNAIFFHYGKEPNFKLIEEYLGQSQTKNRKAIKHIHQIPQPQDPPEILPLPYQVGENQAFLSISYLIEQKDNIKYLALELLQLILFNEQSGLLFPILEDSLAEQFTKSHGTEQLGNYFVFNIGFQGVKKNRQNQSAIEERVFKVFDILKDKVPQDIIDSSLHQLEVSIKQPYHDQGIRILQTLINPLLNNQKIESYLQIDKSFDQLKKKVQDGYLSQLIREEFINPKIFFAQPDKHYIKEQLNHEKHLLSQIKDKQIQQASKQVFDSSILPTLLIEDIQKKSDWTNFNKFEYKGVQFFETSQKTNGITYFKFQFNLGMISDQTKQYLDMFCHLIDKFGTNSISHSQLRLLINQYTIGLECTYDCVDKINTYITINIASFHRNIQYALDILSQLLTDIKINDRKHFSTLLRNNQADLQDNLIKEQTKYATQSSNSTISYQFSITDINFHTKFQLNYATNYLKVDGMKKSLYIDDFEFQMTNMLQLCMNKNNMKVIIHHDNKHLDTKPLETFIDSIMSHYKAFNQDPFEDFAQDFTPSFQNQFIKLPTQVNSNSRSYQIPYFGHDDLPSLAVLSDVLSNDYLFTEIREKGGAYGVGCRVRPFKGIFNLNSSQDPNILKTFEIFDQVNLSNFTQQQLDEAKLKVFQTLDAPLEPYHKGSEFLTLKITEDQFNKYREQLLSVTQSDIQRVFEQYIKNQKYSQTTSASEEHPDLKLIENDDQWKLYKF